VAAAQRADVVAAELPGGARIDDLGILALEAGHYFV
jgi:hypothetical protein